MRVRRRARHELLHALRWGEGEGVTPKRWRYVWGACSAAAVMLGVVLLVDGKRGFAAIMAIAVMLSIGMLVTEED